MSYADGKELQFNIKPTDILISTYQPKSALLKVLVRAGYKTSRSYQ